MDEDYNPLSWNQFFDDKKFVTINETDKFCTYLKGNSGPVFYFIHGAGLSSLTWAVLTNSLTTAMECRILAVDLRGHGMTTTSNDFDLSKETLINDVYEVYNTLYGEEKPKLIMIGHSLGGAIAIHLGAKNILPNLQALGVIDVVEGTALASLTTMRLILDKRPNSFSSVESAIQWCINTHVTTNLISARVSMPDQIKEENGKFVWRVDLYKSEKYWQEWFKDISKQFISVPGAKILILAGTDRLDKELTIAQMAGKFQMEVIKKTGHLVHEDNPEDVANIFIRMMKRYKMAKILEE
ncbi:Protein phosphatase methylesterase 1 [Strongyloides ratti]|uniref:Protein phosphatase methylesterase 1 n=1 Tax=Strongyloides ratti TaxID=34506 RepID=A0A090LGC0_STRRB|nr:Protein phosphatase methylesterase 1 [Strongyloides ratti]CEF67173.1 Protein phosphatase methylesterase 1 [Strongyloides ratti]